MALTQKEIKSNFYARRKENGLCVKCGNPIDRDGAYCTECVKKKNENSLQDKHWYKEHKICPICRKNDLFGDEKRCPECSAQAYSHVMDSRERLGKQHYNSIHAEWSKKEYWKRIEQGICTRCGKRNADGGYKTCGICRDKKNNYDRIKYGKPDRKERYKQGLCYFCDNPIKEGYKVCEIHWLMSVQRANTQRAKEARKNHPWVKEDKLIFGNGGKNRDDRERVQTQSEIPRVCG